MHAAFSSLYLSNGMTPPVLAFGASGGGVNIDFDLSVVVMMVVFSLLIVILKPLLFDPVLKIFEEREKRTEGAKAEARKMQEQAGDLLTRYERELERVHQVAGAEREKIRLETARLEQEILAKGRKVASDIVDQGRAKIAKDVQAIQFNLGSQSEQLARQIASRVLGREL
jgi:F-type H+-transporting ATPase subunit b